MRLTTRVFATLVLWPASVQAQQGNASTSFGLHSLQEAIRSAGFPCPIAQLVHTELEDTRGGPISYRYKVHCRQEGVLDLDPKLTYRVRRDGNGRLIVTPWEPSPQTAPGL